MRVTAKDIAGELGLSRPTVSRVLSGDGSHRVSDETRERIYEAARRLEYRPNAVARSLRRGRTDIVGFYAGYGGMDTRDDFLAQTIGGLQSAGGARGLDLLLHDGYHKHSTDEVYKKLHDGRVDGLFLVASPDDPLALRLSKSSLPSVAVADAQPYLPSVVCDDADGMRQIIDYLWARGHRRMAFLAEEHLPVSGQRRLDAFVSLLDGRGVAAEHASIVRVAHGSVESSMEALGFLLSKPVRRRATAICCWNDMTANTLLRACMERGVRVPDDMAIAGFNGIPSNVLPARQLVTVFCPWAGVGETAMEIMLRRMEGETTPTETCLPVTLVAGDTA